jgi:hypothetical protein
MELAGEGGIVNDGQNFRLDVDGGELARASVAGPWDFPRGYNTIWPTQAQRAGRFPHRGAA